MTTVLECDTLNSQKVINLGRYAEFCIVYVILTSMSQLQVSSVLTYKVERMYVRLLPVNSVVLQSTRRVITSRISECFSANLFA